MFSTQIQEMLLASLMEMEFMHRQEELEHLELEVRAMTDWCTDANVVEM